MEFLIHGDTPQAAELGATPKVTDPKISEPIPARKMPKVDEGPRYMTFPLLGNLSNDLSDDEVRPPYNLGPRNYDLRYRPCRVCDRCRQELRGGRDLDRIE